MSTNEEPWAALASALQLLPALEAAMEQFQEKPLEPARRLRLANASLAVYAAIGPSMDGRAIRHAKSTLQAIERAADRLIATYQAQRFEDLDGLLLLFAARRVFAKAMEECVAANGVIADEIRRRYEDLKRQQNVEQDKPKGGS